MTILHVHILISYFFFDCIRKEHRKAKTKINSHAGIPKVRNDEGTEEIIEYNNKEWTQQKFIEKVSGKMFQISFNARLLVLSHVLTFSHGKKAIQSRIYKLHEQPTTTSILLHKDSFIYMFSAAIEVTAFATKTHLVVAARMCR